MKKLFLSLLSLVMSMTMFAQSNVRKMNLIYDGQVVYSRYVSLIDSIKFVLDENAGSGDDITGGEVDPSKQLYVGVVAFNQNVRQMAITSDMEAVKSFINEQTNDKDFTAFAYSVSKGNKQFDAPELPDFDHIFMLNFSDGTDNYSNMKWGEEGRIVNNNFAYDTARYDLSSRVGLNSYAIGFGAKEADFREKMKKIVMGSGSYYAAASSSDLQPTFNEIAKSMLASAKNVLLKTNPGYYVGFYKYFRLSFVAEDGSTDHIYAQMDGTPTTGYTLSISKTDNGYAYFDAPAKGVLDEETGKVHIPLNNLKFVKGGKDLQYKFTIEVSFDGDSYYEDVEEASTAEEISKRIAVVLVLDCSTSMGDAFAPMKAAAVDFIKTMEKMEVTTPDVDIPDVKIPTQEELWASFKTAADVDGDMTSLGTLAELKALETPYVTFCRNMQLDNVQKVFNNKEWTWLRDYIMTAQNAQKGNPIPDSFTATGVQRTVPELTTDIANEGTNWRFAIAAFFMQSQHNAYPVSADFTEAGKPENWGPYYLSANDRNSYSHEYVDLGLSVKWATCNVGATKPEEYGDYFAWGETQPKSYYGWSTYKWCNGSDNTQTKYCTSSSYGSVDNKTVLEAADDAAAANWGGSWRMPTKAEQDELCEQCTWTWTTQNGVNGYKVTSKKNGKSIFLPAAGYRDGSSSLINAGSCGYYWSSSLYTDLPYRAWHVYFDSSYVSRNRNHRYMGRSVRPVCQ